MTATAGSDVVQSGRPIFDDFFQHLWPYIGNNTAKSNFGGLDIILIGDLRQLPPVRSTPIYKQPKQTLVGPILWRNLKFYELHEVMRQENQQFSSMLTKIGNGEQLDEIEITD
ncbi:ATP-dependent DNA helicase [Trichonephila clavipes]|nr:ATP-dependent DNA helicase [Trichonephila clavipes]